MKTRQVNLRLEPSLIATIEAAADAENLDRGSMIRKLLLESLWEWRLRHALRRYQAGEISIGRACEDSGRSHWEMIDLIREHGIVRPIDVEDSLARARLILRRSPGRVAEAAPAYSATERTPAAGPSATPRFPGSRTLPPVDRPRHPSAEAASLPDFPPRPGGILLVGINPAPPSVARGHYYQGRLGRRLWKRLEGLGLLVDPVPGNEDEAFVRAGNGLTDLVKRPTRSASDLGTDELRAGAERLRGLAREWNPRLVLFAFKQAAAVALSNRHVQPGPCGEISGIPAFLLSGPYASRADSKAIDDRLRRLLVD